MKILLFEGIVTSISEKISNLIVWRRARILDICLYLSFTSSWGEKKKKQKYIFEKLKTYFEKFGIRFQSEMELWVVQGENLIPEY